MSFIGNILWIICGGFIVSMLYFIAGLLMCITVIGIPFGLQLFKLGSLAFCPFGKDATFTREPGCLSLGFNVLWILLNWWEIALVHLAFGCICAISIVGIPFAVQHFKLMKMSFFPFGMSIVG